MLFSHRSEKITDQWMYLMQDGSAQTASVMLSIPLPPLILPCLGSYVAIGAKQDLQVPGTRAKIAKAEWSRACHSKSNVAGSLARTNKRSTD